MVTRWGPTNSGLVVHSMVLVADPDIVRYPDRMNADTILIDSTLPLATRDWSASLDRPESISRGVPLACWHQIRRASFKETQSGWHATRNRENRV